MKEIEKKDAPNVSGGIIDGDRRYIDPPISPDFPQNPITPPPNDWATNGQS